MIKNRQTFSIRETAEILIPDLLGRKSYLVTVGLIILMLGLIGGLYQKLPGTVPLYFTLPWGEVRLAPKAVLFMLPALALSFMAINLGLGRLSTKLSLLLPRVLAVATAVITAMLLASLIGIIQSLLL